MSVSNNAATPFFTITTDVETINSTYDIHQIDLDDMVRNGECSEEDEIIIEYKETFDGEKELHVYFVNGGHIIDPTDEVELIQRIYKNREKLEIYQ